MKMSWCFAAVILAFILSGCMSMRGVYAPNGVPFEESDVVIECKYIGRATDRQVADWCEQKMAQGLVEIGRGERIAPDTLSIGECRQIAEEHKGAAVLCYTQYVSREVGGVYMVTSTLATPIYEDVYKNVLIVFGKCELQE